jgi:hypothetical protein
MLASLKECVIGCAGGRRDLVSRPTTERHHAIRGPLVHFVLSLPLLQHSSVA